MILYSMLMRDISLGACVAGVISSITTCTITCCINLFACCTVYSVLRPFFLQMNEDISRQWEPRTSVHCRPAEEQCKFRSDFYAVIVPEYQSYLKNKFYYKEIKKGSYVDFVYQVCFMQYVALFNVLYIYCSLIGSHTKCLLLFFLQTQSSVPLEQIPIRHFRIVG